jgi:CRP-like cAMP-binding protein
MTDMDWIALGLGARVVKYNPYKPICQIWDKALTVYFNLEGDISVAIERRGKYNQEFLDQYQVAVIKAGISFGEIGVLYGENRTASCIAINDVYVIAIDHEIFQYILGDNVRDMNIFRIQMLMSLKIFQNWDRAALATLLKYIYIRSPKHSEYIYKKGEQNLNIYIVVTGELEIVAEYDQKKELEQNKEIAYKNNQEKFEEEYKKKTQSEKSEIPLFKLTPGNYFGDEEGFNVSKMKHSVRVSSNNTKIFLIPKKVNFVPKFLQNIFCQFLTRNLGNHQKYHNTR